MEFFSESETLWNRPFPLIIPTPKKNFLNSTQGFNRENTVIQNRNPYVVNILPNIIFAVKPLPSPLSSDEKLINIWFVKDVIGDGAEFPVTEFNNSSLSLPPLYKFKYEFPS